MTSKFAGRAALTALFLAIALPAGAETAQDGYEALFEQALESVAWDAHERWAFTEAASGSDGDFVGRYDPRLPEEERWTLLSIGGRDPTEDESRQYAERKRSEQHGDNHEDDGEIDRMVDPGSLQLVEETADYWLLRFAPTDDDGDDEMGRKVLERMDGTVKIIKDGHYLEYIDIRNTKPIRPKVGVKMKKFLTRITFGPAVEGGPIVMKSMDVAIKLSAFLLVRVDETESVTFSDFEFAADAG
ncbi:MAG: hypothetical protein OEV10_05945 [Gammaproteobacteria bacterium]|jgi:hypothetical protein|nr:hypothetical protein [Gammaproteobacteria bacterium]MDH3905947.1 hypothetical protein [Gammaproteobacteria bacterium]MDH3954375.1 hypothetical protein [Gammaproteobacteria bacterium]MDH4005123.1 hypothetical protein [Gammaproteobacteria bacterium]